MSSDVVASSSSVAVQWGKSYEKEIRSVHSRY